MARKTALDKAKEKIKQLETEVSRQTAWKNEHFDRAKKLEGKLEALQESTQLSDRRADYQTHELEEQVNWLRKLVLDLTVPADIVEARSQHTMKEKEFAARQEKQYKTENGKSDPTALAKRPSYYPWGV